MLERRQANRQVIGQAVRPLVEMLEQRQMLSAAVDQGVWSIQVDGALASSDNRVVIATRANNSSILQCGVNGKIYARVRASRINSLQLALGAGDDQVTLKLGKHAKRIRADVQGGAGDDVIIGGAEVGRFFGQAGNDTLVGGGGKDRLVGGKGHNALLRKTGLPLGVLRPDPILTEGEPEVDSDNDVTLPGGNVLEKVIGGPATSARYSRWDVARNTVLDNRLLHVSDAADLKNWLIEGAVERWQHSLGTERARTWTDFAEGPGPYYYPRYWYGNFGYLATVSGDARALSNDAATASYSGTNVQEVGVDEADVIETDGEYLYMVSGSKLIIIDAVPAAEAHIVSTTDLDRNGGHLYLDGNRLTIVKSKWETIVSDEYAVGGDRTRSVSICSSRPYVSVTTYDITDRAAPTVVETTTIDGSLSDSRMIDGRLYLTIGSQLELPAPLQFKTGDAEVTGQRVEQRYTQAQYDAIMALPADQRYDRANLPEPIDVTVRWWSEPYRFETEGEYRARLAAMPLEDLLSSYTTTAAGPDGQSTEFSGSAVDASKVLVPSQPDRWTQDTSSIVLLNLRDGAPGIDDSTTIVGMSGQIYASASSLYVHRNDWIAGAAEFSTSLYKFGLGESSITFEASGTVPGTVLNQFSMDEEGDAFRIATTSRSSEAGTSNNVFVMQQQGEDLQIIGGISGLALSERIYSARFVGDRAYLVTFRQVDPLFVLDLSDPRDPRVAGELKIPGYSSYLHPISDNLLLAIGRDATPEGRVKGVQVSLFDVSDPASPTRIDAYTVETVPDGMWGGSTWSEAEHDHHAFSYFPEYGTLALPVRQSYSQNTSEVVLLKIDSQEGISELGTVDHGDGWYGQRNVRIGETLYSISGSSLKAVNLLAPAEVLASITLPEPVIAPGHFWPVIAVDPIRWVRTIAVD